jgi:hypothetical protein
MSSLADLFNAPSINDKRARANWRAAQWRTKQREERLQECFRAVLMMSPPAATVVSRTRPTTCQWIENEAAYPVVAIYCGQPVKKPGCSYCAQHAAVAFAR